MINTTSCLQWPKSYNIYQLIIKANKASKIYNTPVKQKILKLHAKLEIFLWAYPCGKIRYSNILITKSSLNSILIIIVINKRLFIQKTIILEFQPKRKIRLYFKPFLRFTKSHKNIRIITFTLKIKPYSTKFIEH